MAKSSFWARLATKKLTTQLTILLYELMGRMARISLNSFDFSKKIGVDEILLIDSTTITLWDSLSKKFPGTFTHAGIKWHACIDLFSGIIKWIDITPSSTNDNKCFPDFNILKKKLIIFDLGYWNFSFLFAIDDIKGFFLCRVKNKSNILIEGIAKGLNKKFIGTLFSNLVLTHKRKDILELIGGIYNAEKYKQFRLIGFWNNEDAVYHWYLTNLLVPAAVIYPLYRLRWRIELIFKSTKRCLGLDSVPSGNESIATNLLLSSVIAQMSTVTVLHTTSSSITIDRVLSLSVQRIAMITNLLKDCFIDLIINPIKNNYEKILDKIYLLKDESYDPNFNNRLSSVMIVIGALHAEKL